MEICHTNKQNKKGKILGKKTPKKLPRNWEKNPKLPQNSPAIPGGEEGKIQIFVQNLETKNRPKLVPKISEREKFSFFWFFTQIRLNCPKIPKGEEKGEKIGFFSLFLPSKPSRIAQKFGNWKIPKFDFLGTEIPGKFGDFPALFWVFFGIYSPLGGPN